MVPFSEMPFENNGEGDSEGIGVRTIYIFNRGSQGGSSLGWGVAWVQASALCSCLQQAVYLYSCHHYCTELHLVARVHSGAFPSLTGLF